MKKIALVLFIGIIATVMNPTFVFADIYLDNEHASYWDGQDPEVNPKVENLGNITLVNDSGLSCWRDLPGPILMGDVSISGDSVGDFWLSMDGTITVLGDVVVNNSITDYFLLDGGEILFNGNLTLDYGSSGSFFSDSGGGEMSFNGTVTIDHDSYGGFSLDSGGGEMSFLSNVNIYGDGTYGGFSLYDGGTMTFAAPVTMNSGSMAQFYSGDGDIIFESNVVMSGEDTWGIFALSSEDAFMDFRGDVYVLGDAGSFSITDGSWMIFRGKVGGHGEYNVGEGARMQFSDQILGEGTFNVGPGGEMVIENVTAGNNASFTVSGMLADMYFGPGGMVTGGGSYTAVDNGWMVFEGGVGGNAYHYAANEGFMWFPYFPDEWSGDIVSGDGTYIVGEYGEMQFDKPVINNSDAANFKIVGIDGKMAFYRDVYGDGDYQVLADGGNMSFYGEVHGNGTHNVQQNGEMSFHDIVAGNGEYYAGSGGIMTFTGDVSGNGGYHARPNGTMLFYGTVSGDGTYDVANNATMEFNGDVTNTSGSALYTIVGANGEMTFAGNVSNGGFYRVMQPGTMTFKADAPTDGIYVLTQGAQMVFEDDLILDSATPGRGIIRDLNQHSSIDVYGDLINHSPWVGAFDIDNIELSVFNTDSGFSHDIDWLATNFGRRTQGLKCNLAIGQLVLGDDAGGASTDIFQFSPDTIIYCYGLSLLEDASVNLNGATIYYLNAGHVYNGITGTGFSGSGTFSGGQILPIITNFSFWNGVGNYSETAKWSAGVVPTADDYIHINTGAVSLDSNREVKSFEVTAGTVFNLGNFDYTIYDDSSVKDTGLLIMAGAEIKQDEEETRILYNEGDISGYGIINPDVMNFGTISVDSGETLTMKGNVSGGGIYQFNENGTMVFEGNLTLDETAEIHNTTNTYMDVYGDLTNNSQSFDEFVAEELELSIYSPTGASHYVEWLANDFGQSISGLNNNMVIGNLLLGDGLGGVDTDLFQFSADTIIYCYGLSILADAQLDLNGATIYYLQEGWSYNGIMGTGFNEYGSYSGGNIYPIVPEPASFLLLGFGVVGIVRLFSRKK